MGRTSATHGCQLDVAAEQLERWRRSRNRGRMPMSLWRLAAEAAVAAGVEVVATRLQLDVERLRERMRTWDLREGQPAATPFVELPSWLPGTSNAEFLLEAESPTGRKLRIVLKGDATAQALALSELLLRSPQP